MSPGFSTSSESEIWSDNYALCGLTEDAEKQDYMDMNEVSREYLRNYMIYLHKRKAALICKLHRRDMKKFGPYLESYFRLKESRKRGANHESRRLFEKLGEDSELSDTFSSDEDYTIKPSSSMLKYIVESEIMDGERNCLLLKGTISDKRGREGMLEKAYYNEYNVFKKKCMRDLDEIYENDLNYNNLNSEPSLLRPHVKKRPLEREIGDSKSHLETLNSSHNKESKQALTESHYVQIWTTLVNRNVNRSAKMMQNFRTTKINNMFKVAQVCAKESKRAKPVQVKIIAKMKKISKDVALFWRKNEREVRDLKKIAEKDALEQKKREEELLEARRQARKLNFLITQTELYSHFIAKKLQASEDRDTSDEHYNENLDEPDFDKENDEELLLRAKGSAKKALLKHGEATKRFDMETLRMKRNALKEEQKKNLSLSADMVDKMDFMNPSSLDMDSEVEVPKMLTVTLKAYQVKGLRWLANLYEQGINGILADEMGLGKTVQSIALMAYLAERYNIWGPFLIVSPLSTLHNWQQEIVRFAPDLKVIPYWGDQRDRAVIRKLWSSNKIYTKNTPFHVIITSYQIVVIDEHHLKKVRWHYMILDEAQAIKSSDSTRWKTLLGFDCRSRLLLTGTPIQNSMQELWALLHFIMPSLFDSHKEFSSWFSRDIECHAENKGSLNEQQLQKLHVILKPFMLRRVKKDVENELSEKIEIELRCNLSVRQKMLYKLLKERLLSSELLDKVSLMSEKQIIGSRFGDNIMNLVMQFRKVCNHPALFEKSDIWSPLFFSPVRHIPSGAGRHNCHIPYSAVSLLEYKMPKLFTLNGFLDKKDCTSDKVKVDIDLFALHNIRESLSRNSIFSFLPFCGLSMSEIHKISRARYPTELFLFWLLKMEKLKPIQDYQNFNCMEPKMRSMLNIVNRNPLPKLCDLYMKESSTRRFTSDPPIASSLGDFLIKNYTYDIKRRLQRAVKTKVYSSICSLDAGSHPYSKWMKDNITHEKTMSAILTGNTCSKLHNTWHTQLFYEWIDLLKPFYVSSESRITKVASSPSALGTKFSGLLGDSDKNQSHYDVIIPSVYRLISDSGKLYVLDKILPELKAGGHRILAFFQMTKMIDIMEDYLALRKYTYIRLDGSTNISDRREMVMDWQSRPDLFIFLLSTRAGGIGINLTAADTVIFYDSDWNPTVDQQAMDRCHRLGQKKQVTIYRLITADTIEERILTRAQQKDKIQRVVIPGGEFKQQVEFKHKEMYNLLLEEGENNEYKGSGTLKE